MPNIIESEEQRPGRNKHTTVNKTYINSGEYRRKFDKLSPSSDLNRLLYNLAKKMLNHRSGTLYEDMYWIDGETASIVAEELTARAEERIDYSAKTRKTVADHPGLITIHSHPNSFPPSIDDMNSNYINGYHFGVVAAHDGKLYAYSSNEVIEEEYFSLLIASYKNLGYNEYEAQIAALKECNDNFDIYFEEVI